MAEKINLSLLYVEDEEMILESMGTYLKRRFRDIYLADDGESGFQKFLEFRPDIVVTDIEMPRIGGIEMCAEIRKIDKDIPIVIVTAFSEPELMQKCKELNVNAYLLKPVDFDELNTIIFELAERISLKKESLQTL